MAPAAFGGLERVVEALARGHGAAGHRVRVAALLEREDDARHFVRSLREAGVEVDPLVLPGRAYLRERASVAGLCSLRRPSVVHTHGYRPDVVDSGVARALGIAVVTTAHGFTGGGWKDRLYERLQVSRFRRFDAVVAVSRPLEEHLAARGVPRDRLHLIPNAWAAAQQPLDRVAARERLGLPGSGLVVGWVGRLSAEKGPDVLMEALPHCTGAPFGVSLLGDGAARRRLEADARRLQVDRRVRFHGLVPDAGTLMSAFDVFVLSSRTEGTPIVLFEAMAAGVPVVATRVGGVPDVVTDEEAFLVPPEDPAALAAAISLALADREESQRRAGAAARRLRGPFAYGPWLERYEDVYRRAIARVAGRR